MANLVQHGETALHSLAISAAPCGHCRQFYSELACAVSVDMCCAGTSSEQTA
jgi:cytidine deaminase